MFLQWNDIPPAEFILEDEKMFFVNRDAAVKKLCQHHSGASIRRTQAGLQDRIAILDDSFGMGKTAFGDNYISRCRSIEGLQCSTGFEESFKKARTISIKLDPQCLLKEFSKGAQDCDIFLKNLILNALKEPISKNHLVGDVSILMKSETTKELLEVFVEVTGVPLLLVLDEVPDAFSPVNNETLVERKNIFLSFARTILRVWIRIKNFYLLLLGRGDIFDLIADKSPDHPYTGSKLGFERIPLSLIHEEYIGKILSETKRKLPNGALVTLKEFYQIHTEQDMKKAVKAILASTNGHPRSMCQMFKECLSPAQLFNFYIPLESGSVKQWIAGLLPFADSVGELVASANTPGMTVDLTRKIFTTDPSENKAFVADKALIRWEGSMSEASLFISDNIMVHLYELFAPCKTFLMHYDVNRRLKLNHDGNFELLCLKRFQEICHQWGEAKKMLPSWFDGTVFGEIEGLEISKRITKVPKVTSQGLKYLESLDQSTLHPDCLPELIALLRASKPACYVPAERSASTDIVIVTEGKLPGDEVNRVITIGLAVKCFNNTSLQPSMITDELKLFSRLVSGSEIDSTKRLNILFFCCSGDSAKFAMEAERNFHTVPIPVDCPHIDEAIYLDLSSKDLRSEFFDVHDPKHAHLSHNLQLMIQKPDVRDKQ